MKRIASILLLLTMVLSMFPTSVFADITTAGGSNDVPVELTQAVSEFSVTVPTVLPVDVSADGEVTVATDNKIINNSWGPIEVKDVYLVSQNDWELVDFETDFKTKNVGLKEYGFKINDAAVEVDGGCAAEFEVINGNSEISFTYDANIATQKTALEDVEISQVVFVIGWATGDLVAGLYDANGVMLCSWEDSGIDLAQDYLAQDFVTREMLSTNYPTATKVVIPEGTTYIGKYMFDKCETITDIVIPETVTEISGYAFYSCYNLKTVNLPDNLTEISNGLFYHCNSLEYVDVPNGVTKIGAYAFLDSGLKSIDIPDEVTEIHQMAFRKCHGLTELKLPNNLSTVDKYLSDDCDNLSVVYIPAGVTNIGEYAFADCPELRTIYYGGTEEQWIALNKGGNWHCNITNGVYTDFEYEVIYNYQG